MTSLHLLSIWLCLIGTIALVAGEKEEERESIFNIFEAAGKIKIASADYVYQSQQESIHV